jgi:hypothetical protein
LRSIILPHPKFKSITFTAILWHSPEFVCGTNMSRNQVTESATTGFANYLIHSDHPIGRAFPAEEP